MSVATGFAVMQTMFETEITRVTGPKGKPDPVAHRGAPRPRARLGDPGRPSDAGESASGPAPATGTRCRSSRTHFSADDLLSPVVLERMLAGVATRRPARTAERSARE